MVGTVTFVAEDDDEEAVSLFLLGPEKNRVNVAHILQFFQVPMVLVKDIKTS
jgi:hypothetical protein